MPRAWCPPIAQQHDRGEVLMMAWMDRDAVAETMRTGRVCYWSRSRRAPWRKGDTSGHIQELVDFASIATATRCW
jgi:phosphoribosyl-AMP cyclohydrolase